MRFLFNDCNILNEISLKKITYIIDQYSLYIYFDNILQKSYSLEIITLPPEDTVHRIVLGQPYSLENYRSKEDKISLLDYAILTLDSSAITAIVLFLEQTLRTSVFKEVGTFKLIKDIET